MKQINAYLNFKGNCREAMTFYKDCLGGELNIMSLKDMPAGMPCPEGTENNVMHSELKNEGGSIMATDMNAPEGLQPGNNFSLAAACSSEEEMNKKFDAIMQGGQVYESPKMQFWGDYFGFGADKFGTKWMFTYSPARN
jgi:PhnB protein